MLFGLGIVAFVLCQAFAFWWLPEGLLRGRSAGAVITGSEAAASFTVEWMRIALFNIAVLLLAYVTPNLLRLPSGVPLGYVPVIVMQGYFGVITGTNSFTMSATEGKIAPSFEWLTRPGFYELAAFALATAATFGISRWQDIEVDGRRRAVRIAPPAIGWGHPQTWAGLILALTVLVAADAWEAHLIMSS